MYVIRGGWSISYEGVYLKAESLYVDRLGSEQQLPLEKMFLALLVVEISWFEKLWRVHNKWGGSAKKMTRAIRGGTKK